MNIITYGDASDNGRRPDDLLDDGPDMIDLEGVLGDEGEDGLVEAEEVKSDAVALGRPKKTEWVRCHPDPAHCRPVTLLEHPGRKWSFFAVAADLQNLEELDDQLATFTAVTTVNLNGDLLLWTLRQGRGFGSDNPWVESARGAALRARTAWVRVRAGTDAYKITVARGDLGLPDFRGLTFQEVLTRALKGRMIATADHPILRLLRGEVREVSRDP
jgi:hypothetical protein